MKIFKNIIIATAVMLLLSFCFLEFVITSFKTTSVFVSKVNETIYLTHKTGGLNTDIICISNTKRRHSLLKTEYCYINFEETIFYRVSNDTIYILCSLPIEEDIELGKNIVIIQEQYSNQQYFNELRENYKNLGLEKFPPNRN